MPPEGFRGAGAIPIDLDQSNLVAAETEVLHKLDSKSAARGAGYKIAVAGDAYPAVVADERFFDLDAFGVDRLREMPQAFVNLFPSLEDSEPARQSFGRAGHELPDDVVGMVPVQWLEASVTETCEPLLDDLGAALLLRHSKFLRFGPEDRGSGDARGSSQTIETPALGRHCRMLSRRAPSIGLPTDGESDPTPVGTTSSIRNSPILQGTDSPADSDFPQMPFIEFGARRVNYELPTGADIARPRGKLVLLVHGAFDSSTYWYHIFRHLQNNHTPLAIDLPGHGGSDGLVLRGAEEHIAFVAALVDALDLPSFVFCGHSMGGSMAVEYALHHAPRLSGLVALGSSPDWEIEESDIDIWDRDPDGAFRSNLEYLFAREASGDMRDAYNRQMRTTPAAVCKADLETCRSFDLSDRLHEVQVPAAVICGDQEFWIEGSRRLHKGIAGSHFEIVPAAGHAIALEQPQALNAALDGFLASLA